jgi:hypothetical protein
MSYTHAYDRCGRPLGKDETRFIAKIQVYAETGPIEITEEDLAEDQTKAIESASERAESMSEEEMMKDVFVEMKFDLCRPCQREYLENPLP